MFKIMLESKEKQKFQFETNEVDREVAKEKALSRIVELAYDMYEYKIISIEEKTLS